MPDDPIDAAIFAELQDTAGTDFVKELISTFLQEAPQMLAEMRSAQAGGAPERLRRAAHSLKSNANTFGALQLGEMARILEIGGADAAALAALSAEYERAAAALRKLCHG